MVVQGQALAVRPRAVECGAGRVSSRSAGPAAGRVYTPRRAAPRRSAPAARAAPLSALARSLQSTYYTPDLLFNGVNF